jgi:ankyrin repeat protein
MFRLIFAAFAVFASLAPVLASQREFDAALAAGHIAAIRAELERGADPAARRDMTFETPLHRAAQWATVETVRLLIEAGAPLDARDWDGRTPLWIAAWLGRHEIVAALIDAGAGLDIRDETGRSPLVAVLTNRPDPDWERAIDDPFVSTRERILALRVRPGRDYDAVVALLAERTQDLDTALAEAVWGGWEGAARILVRRGALVHGTTLDGKATLAGVFHYPDMAMFDLLVAANVDLALAGAETIVAAAAAGRMDIVRALLARRWQVDTPDKAGRTALMAAAVNARQQAVAELLALGADPAMRDRNEDGIAEQMTARLAGLVALALQREASRAYMPTDFIRSEAARLNAAYDAMLPALGLAQHAGTLMPKDED